MQNTIRLTPDARHEVAGLGIERSTFLGTIRAYKKPGIRKCRAFEIAQKRERYRPVAMITCLLAMPNLASVLPLVAPDLASALTRLLDTH